MVRTQIYLTVGEKRQLELTAARLGVSQSDLIRRAVDELLDREENAGRKDILAAAAGLWTEDRIDINSLRGSWTGRNS